jgi:hypothetical protein
MRVSESGFAREDIALLLVKQATSRALADSRGLYPRFEVPF